MIDALKHEKKSVTCFSVGVPFADRTINEWLMSLLTVFKCEINCLLL